MFKLRPDSNDIWYLKYHLKKFVQVFLQSDRIQFKYYGSDFEFNYKFSDFRSTLEISQVESLIV